MRIFGLFEGMKYGKCEEKFDSYKEIKNQLNKADVLAYLKALPIAGIAPMSVEDIFTGEPLEQAGVIDDGEFRFPIDFIHYYEQYDIGIPKDYEEYIASRIN